MTYFADLSSACQLASGDDVKAVGWLDKDYPFTKGTVEAEFLETLKQHIAERWTIVVAAGFHECNLCDKFWSGGNLIAPTEEFIYIAPEMIAHYIEAHGYKPPDEFIEAVMKCPPQESPEYMKSVQKFMYHWE